MSGSAKSTGRTPVLTTRRLRTTDPPRTRGFTEHVAPAVHARLARRFAAAVERAGRRPVPAVVFFAAPVRWRAGGDGAAFESLAQQRRQRNHAPPQRHA